MDEKRPRVAKCAHESVRTTVPSVNIMGGQCGPLLCCFSGSSTRVMGARPRDRTRERFYLSL